MMKKTSYVCTNKSYFLSQDSGFVLKRGMDYADFQHSNIQSMDKLFCFKYTVPLTKIFSYHLQLGAEIMATSYRTWLQSYGTVIFSSKNKHQSLSQASRGRLIFSFYTEIF
jgi:hypothetical protein